jgi:hypothetical protein
VKSKIAPTPNASATQIKTPIVAGFALLLIRSKWCPF